MENKVRWKHRRLEILNIEQSDSSKQSILVRNMSILHVIGNYTYFAKDYKQKWPLILGFFASA